VSPRLCKLSHLGHLLGLPACHLERLARLGKVKAVRVSAFGTGPKAGHYYVTTTEACRILREMMLTGQDYEAGRRAVYRAARRTADSTRNTGLHEVGPTVGKVKPGTE